MYLPQAYSFIKFNYTFILFYVLISLFVAVNSVNLFLTFFSLIVLVVSIKLVWRVNEPPIFAFIILYHWFQISLKIFHANFLNKDIQYIAISNSTDKAILLSLIGLLVLSLGIHFIIRRTVAFNINDILIWGNNYSLKKLFFLYLSFFIIFIFFSGIRLLIPGLTQIIVAILNFKILLIYFIFTVSFIQKKHNVLLYIVLIETLFGFTGFFSTFKLPYFLLIISYFTINQKITFRNIKYVVPVIVFLILMALTWTAIKSDYRSAISGYSKTQEVTVDYNEQIDILYSNLSKVDFQILAKSAEALATRLAYVDFFGQVIDYVPRSIEHEYGSLWYGSITHIFTPRILFPNKPIMDDSARTMKYTGNSYAGIDKGASIGIGYFAESYIDFGEYFMFLPLFLLGIFYGVIYNYLKKRLYNPILAYSIIVAILFIGYPFEIRNDKLFGGILMSFIVMILMNKFFMSSLFSFSNILKKGDNEN